MKAVGDFIENYRILVELSSQPIGDLYLVEQTSHIGPPTLLLFWTTVELSRDEDRKMFLQKSKDGTIQRGLTSIPILDAGIDNQHPYVTTPYAKQTEEILRAHIGFIEQAFQSINRFRPDDTQAQSEAFLRLFLGVANQSNKQQPGSTKPSTTTQQPRSSERIVRGRQQIISGYRRLKLWQRIVLAIMVLLLIGWGSVALYSIIPAWAATVTIMPVKKTLNQSYQVLVVQYPTLSSSIKGRQISITSQQLTRTVVATGKGHHDAIAATGNLVYSNIHLDVISPGGDYLVPSTIRSQSGVSITTEGDIPISEGATVTAHAHADQAGTGGNIGAYDFNSSIEIVDQITNAHMGTAYITNPQPFAGGTEAFNFLFVQQTDIDKVVTASSTQLMSDTQKKTLQQIQPGERQAGDIQCTPNSSSNHKANDPSDNVTIKVSITCATLVYNEQALHQTAITEFKNDGFAQFGQSYDVVGDMLVSTPELTFSAPDSAEFSFQIEGTWSFQWTSQHQRELQQLIAGKPQNAAMQLLGGREDIKNMSISNNWFPGSALPANPADIKLTILKVQG